MQPYFGSETFSWAEILDAAPFVALESITYNAMNAERLIWAWLKSEAFIPKQLTFESDSFL